MKWWKVIPVICISVLFIEPLQTKAQSQEAQQLILNVIKLAQLKKILNDLYQGYEIVSKGYGAIKNISEGNFSLHKDFLDNLLNINPAIARYKRVSDIVQYQISIVKEYKSAYSAFRLSDNFTGDELEYMSKVYTNLFNRSVQNLDGLLMIITASKLRMSDDERLLSIDRIFSSMEDQLSFLRSFNNQAKMLGLQRKFEQHDIKSTRELYNLK